MGQSVPLAHVDVVFVREQAYVGKESLGEVLVLDVSQGVGTRLRKQRNVTEVVGKTETQARGYRLKYR